MADFVSRVVICSDDPIHRCLGPSYALGALSNDQHVLLIFVVWLRGGVLFLRILASDQNLAPCFLLKALLVETFRSNEHANVVDARVLRNVNLFLDFRSVLERV